MVGKAFAKELLKMLFLMAFVLLLGYLVQTSTKIDIMLDENAVGWFWGVAGTLYALITTFSLVSVWNQFNEVEDLLSKEAQNLIAIWTTASYLDDKATSNKLRPILLKYIDTAINLESAKLAAFESVPHYSEELSQIAGIIDDIDFNSEQDATVFNKMVDDQEALSAARNRRIELGVTRIPPLVKVFFLSVSTVFVLGSVFHGFNSVFLYYFSLTSITFLVLLSVVIVLDTDNPFEGIWNLSWKAFEEAKDFILKHPSK